MSPFAPFWPTAVKLGEITNFNFLVTGFIGWKWGHLYLAPLLNLFIKFYFFNVALYLDKSARLNLLFLVIVFNKWILSWCWLVAIFDFKKIGGLFSFLCLWLVEPTEEPGHGHGRSVRGGPGASDSGHEARGWTTPGRKWPTQEKCWSWRISAHGHAERK